jgi:excisionase family DNA binding protein
MQADTPDEGGQVRAEAGFKWITYRQAEEFSGLSRTTLWKLISAGSVEAARVGRAVRISRRSLEEYMERAAGERAE